MWGGYIQISTFGKTTVTVRAFDLNPPIGMVLIPWGSFVMGATTNVGHEGAAEETPQHRVSVSEFYMARYEVTKSRWDEIANWAATNGYGITREVGQARRPIIR
jgi:formylglycine-generating enzyme required for sulfatase activity